VRALKKIQLDVTKIEGKFYEEMHALECKYLPMYQPLFDKVNLEGRAPMSILRPRISSI
jgi:hypothetical protein